MAFFKYALTSGKHHSAQKPGAHARKTNPPARPFTHSHAYTAQLSVATRALPHHTQPASSTVPRTATKEAQSWQGGQTRLLQSPWFSLLLFFKSVSTQDHPALCPASRQGMATRTSTATLMQTSHKRMAPVTSRGSVGAINSHQGTRWFHLTALHVSAASPVT